MNDQNTPVREKPTAPMTYTVIKGNDMFGIDWIIRMFRKLFK